MDFTYCQIPIIYKLGNEAGVQVELDTQETIKFQKLDLDAATSSMLFKRTGQIDKIIVHITN